MPDYEKMVAESELRDEKTVAPGDRAEGKESTPLVCLVSLSQQGHICEVLAQLAAAPHRDGIAGGFQASGLRTTDSVFSDTRQGDDASRIDMSKRGPVAEFSSAASGLALSVQCEAPSL